MLTSRSIPRPSPTSQRFKTNTNKIPRSKEQIQPVLITRSLKKPSHSKSKSLSHINHSQRKAYESVVMNQQHRIKTDRDKMESVQVTKKIAIKIGNRPFSKMMPQKKRQSCKGYWSMMTERKGRSKGENKTLEIEDIILQSPYFKQHNHQENARILFSQPR